MNENSKRTASRRERRRLLKALAGGGAAVLTAASLPQRWVRPAVDAVVLPAHAQATLTNCLLRGSRIRMADGSSRAIESLRIGDFVAGATSAVAVVTTAPREHLRDHFYRINDDLCLTGDHPAMVRTAAGSAWRRVDALAAGDRLVTAAGTLRIDSICRVNVPVFTIYVETSSGAMLAGRGGIAVRSRYLSRPSAARAPGRAAAA